MFIYRLILILFIIAIVYAVYRYLKHSGIIKVVDDLPKKEEEIREDPLKAELRELQKELKRLKEVNTQLPELQELKEQIAAVKKQIKDQQKKK